eukprot:scaffold235891_cov36-Tisochrysis_lutea.AAC.1
MFDSESDGEGEVPPLLGLEGLRVEPVIALPEIQVPQAPPPLPARSDEAAERANRAEEREDRETLEPSSASLSSSFQTGAHTIARASGSSLDGALTGRLVQIHGLSGRPQLNGKVVKAGNWLPEKQRYELRLGASVLAIRPENLRLNEGTGGQAQIKKGFLAADALSKGDSTNSDLHGSGPIPMVRGDGEGGRSSLKLPEVQAGMAESVTAAAAAQAGGSKDGWVTPELLSKIAADPLLRKAFTDPK